MSAPKHTPGPWLAVDAHVFKPNAHGDWLHGIKVADLPRDFPCDDDEWETILANARIIAACPEMYEALTQARIAIAGGCETEDDRQALLAELDAAIAKAEGRK